MFIDSSAILAILLGEKEAPAVVAAMQKTRKRYFSPIVRFETIIRLASIKSGAGKPVNPDAFDKASLIVDMFASQYNVAMMPIADKESRLSLDAYRNFGKGTGHKAQLNMGDCFSYACAKSKNLSLLCKGNDFIHTDIDIGMN